MGEEDLKIQHVEIVIDKELKSLLPDLTDTQYASLERAIIQEGCREPLVLWADRGKNILIGGHNRRAICLQHGIKYEVIFAEGVKSRLDAKIWILRDQLGKRNLTDFDRARMALQLEDSVKQQARKNQLSGLKQYSEAVREKSTERDRLNTRETLAELAGVSSNTISKVKKITQAATKEQIEELEKGNISINKLHHDLKHSDKQDPSAEIDRLIRKFKWAARREIIPIGSRLLDDRDAIRPDQKNVLISIALDLSTFLNKMLESLQTHRRNND